MDWVILIAGIAVILFTIYFFIVGKILLGILGILVAIILFFLLIYHSLSQSFGG